MGVASLVLGIVSIVTGVFFAGSIGWLGAIIGVVGLILGAVARKNDPNTSMASAGLVCSIIGLVLNLILFIACVACIGGLASLSN